MSRFCLFLRRPLAALVIQQLLQAGSLWAGGDDARSPVPPSNCQELASRYSQLVAELAESLGTERSEVIAIAKELVKKLKPQLLALEVSPGKLEKGFVRAGPRVLPRTECISLVQTLGELSLRLTAAQTWTAYALRDERLKKAAARRDVEARYLQEVCRAYREYQGQLQARQHALFQLRLLATGRGKLVITETYSGGGSETVEQRLATFDETALFARDRAAFANSPIYVARPHKMILTDVFSPQRLVKLAVQKPDLDQLAGIVDTELKHLADRHRIRVTVLWDHGEEKDKAMAIMSLGWWNGDEERKLVDEALKSDSELMRRAGICALARFQHGPTSLSRLARHDCSEVRQAAAELTSQHIQNPTQALQVLKKLLADRDEPVRRAAYDAIDPLMVLANCDGMTKLGYFDSLLKDDSPEVVVAAVEWLANCQDNFDPNFVQAKCSRIRRLERHPNAAVCRAATQALITVSPVKRE